MAGQYRATARNVSLTQIRNEETAQRTALVIPLSPLEVGFPRATRFMESDAGSLDSFDPTQNAPLRCGRRLARTAHITQRRNGMATDKDNGVVAHEGASSRANAAGIPPLQEEEERVPVMQQILDNPFLLLFLGVAIPTVIYIVWGVRGVHP